MVALLTLATLTPGRARVALVAMVTLLTVATLSAGRARVALVALGTVEDVQGIARGEGDVPAACDSGDRRDAVAGIALVTLQRVGEVRFGLAGVALLLLPDDIRAQPVVALDALSSITGGSGRAHGTGCSGSTGGTCGTRRTGLTRDPGRACRARRARRAARAGRTPGTRRTRNTRRTGCTRGTVGTIDAIPAGEAPLRTYLERTLDLLVEIPRMQREVLYIRGRKRLVLHVLSGDEVLPSRAGRRHSDRQDTSRRDGDSLGITYMHNTLLVVFRASSQRFCAVPPVLAGRRR